MPILSVSGAEPVNTNQLTPEEIADADSNQGCDFRGSKASELGIRDLGSTDQQSRKLENFQHFQSYWMHQLDTPLHNDTKNLRKDDLPRCSVRKNQRKSQITHKKC